MTEQEQKAIKWMQNVRDDAVVTLDHIATEEPNVSPMLYAGRKEKAETIVKGFEELEQYRAISTVEKVREYKEIADNMNAVSMAKLCVSLNKLEKYERVGTPEECWAAVQKQRAKKPVKRSFIIPYEGIEVCPNCKEPISKKEHHCKCGQAIDWGEEE